MISDVFVCWYCSWNNGSRQSLWVLYTNVLVSNVLVLNLSCTKYREVVCCQKQSKIIILSLKILWKYIQNTWKIYCCNQLCFLLYGLFPAGQLSPFFVHSKMSLLQPSSNHQETTQSLSWKSRWKIAKSTYLKWDGWVMQLTCLNHSAIQITCHMLLLKVVKNSFLLFFFINSV